MHGNSRDHYLAGISGVDANGRLGLHRFDQAVTDRKRPDRRQHVAAAAPGRDRGLVDAYLIEGIFDIGVRTLRKLYHRCFAGQRIGPPDAVDLTVVGRSIGREQNGVALGLILRQIIVEEEPSPTRSAAHKGARNCELLGAVRRRPEERRGRRK